MFLAKQPEGGDASVGNNTHLADAFTWLASAEAQLGRRLEAEAHHRSAARAVEDCGLVETSSRRGEGARWWLLRAPALRPSPVMPRPATPRPPPPAGATACRRLTPSAAITSPIRTLHLLHHYRGGGEFGKHKAVTRAWAAALEAAAKAAPPAWPTQPYIGSGGGGCDDEADAASAGSAGSRPPPAPSTPPPPASSSAAAAAASSGAARPPSQPSPPCPPVPVVGVECALDCLVLAAALLHERAMSYHARGKQAKAAALACGPLLSLSCRVEAHPLRPRPGPGGAGGPGSPCPLPPLCADLAAQCWQGAGKGAHAAACLRLRAGLLAMGIRWKGTQPICKDAHFPAGWVAGGGAGRFAVAGAAAAAEAPLLTAAQLAVTDGWKDAVARAGAAAGAAAADGAPPPVAAGWLPPPLLAAADAAVAAAVAEATEGWRPSAADCAPPPAPGGGDPATPRDQAAAEAGALGAALSALAACTLAGGGRGPGAAAHRPALAAARLLGRAGLAPQQADALHLAGAAAFHAGRPRHAADALAASAAAKEALGALGGAAPPALVAGCVETLLFLAKALVESGSPGEGEGAASKGLALARARCGDAAPLTRKALQACVDAKRAAKAGGAAGAGGRA